MSRILLSAVLIKDKRLRLLKTMYVIEFTQNRDAKAIGIGHQGEPE
jgi:hypothetical protein